MHLPGLRLSEDLSAGIQALYDALLKARLDLDRFESAEFTRLKQIRSLLQSGRLAPTLRWKQVA